MRPSLRFACALALMAAAVAARADEPATCNQVEMTSVATADLPQAVWAALPRWSARLKFKIDPANGSAAESVVTAFEQNSASAFDEATLRRIAADTMNRFRFCVPSDYEARSNWIATLRFTPIAARSLYVQAFEPAYTREEIREGRTGTVSVQAVFDVDGHISSADVRSSSGDEVLDRKAVRSVMSDRLIVARGLPLEKPLSFVQPFTFRIQ